MPVSAFQGRARELKVPLITPSPATLPGAAESVQTSQDSFHSAKNFGGQSSPEYRQYGGSRASDTTVVDLDRDQGQ